jgi:hypothetical protein
MTTGATIACPHCSAANAAGAQFCETCGKALPTMGGGPRVVTGSAFASTAAGQKLQSEELHKQARKAAGALLAVAIIQTIRVGIIVALASSEAHVSISRLLATNIVLSLIAFAVIFWAIYIWALKQPLPAAIVGLILYATLLALNVVTSVGQLSKGNQGSGQFGGIGIGWIDIVILAVLIRAISAGSQYRKMMQSGVPVAG